MASAERAVQPDVLQLAQLPSRRPHVQLLGRSDFAVHARVTDHNERILADGPHAPLRRKGVRPRRHQDVLHGPVLFLPSVQHLDGREHLPRQQLAGVLAVRLRGFAPGVLQRHVCGGRGQAANGDRRPLAGRQTCGLPERGEHGVRHHRGAGHLGRGRASRLLRPRRDERDEGHAAQRRHGQARHLRPRRFPRKSEIRQRLDGRCGSDRQRSCVNQRREAVCTCN